MNFALDILRAIYPLIIVGGIAVFVVMRMKYKYEKGTLGKKVSKSAQSLLDSLIPLGMLIGFIVGGLTSMITPISVLDTISLGSGVGLLFGYFAYEIYSRKEESY